MLGIIGRDRAMPQAPLATLKRQDAGQYLKQSGLARPVRSHQRHPLTPAKSKIEIAVNGNSPVCFADMMQTDDFLAAPRRLGKAETDLFKEAGWLHPLNFGQAFHAALHLASLGSFSAEALN